MALFLKSKAGGGKGEGLNSVVPKAPGLINLCKPFAWYSPNIQNQGIGIIIRKVTQVLASFGSSYVFDETA